MKYIRAKDGVYEIDKDISYGGKEIYKMESLDIIANKNNYNSNNSGG